MSADRVALNLDGAKLLEGQSRYGVNRVGPDYAERAGAVWLPAELPIKFSTQQSCLAMKEP